MPPPQGVVVPPFPYSELGPVTVNEDALARQDALLKRNLKLYISQQLADDEFEGLEAADDEQIKQLAVDSAYQLEPTAHKERKVELAKDWLMRLRNVRNMRLHKLEKSKREMDRLKPPEALAERPVAQPGLPPPKTDYDERSWAHPLKWGAAALDWLGVGGDVTQGAKTGTVAALREQAQPLTPEEIERAVLESTRKEGAFADAVARSQAQRFSFMPTKPRVADAPPQAPLLKGPLRKGGAPAGTPEDIARGIETAAGALGTNMFSRDAPQLANELTQLNEWYKQQAVDYVLKKHPDLPKEEKLKLAQKVKQAMLDQDELGTQIGSPKLAQLGYELAGDFAAGNLVSAPVRMAGAAWQGAKQIPAVAKLADRAFDATLPMRRNPGAAVARRAGVEDQALLMERAQDVGEVAGDLDARRYAEIDKVLGQVPKAQRETLDLALNQELPGHEFSLFKVDRDKALAEPYNKIRDITDEQYDLGVELGKLNRAKDGTIEAAKQIEEYTPLKVLQEGAQQELEAAVKEAKFTSLAEARAAASDPGFATKVAGKLEAIPEELRNMLRATTDESGVSVRGRMKGATGAEQQRTGAALPWETSARKQFQAAARVEPKATARAKELGELNNAGMFTKISAKDATPSAVKAANLKALTGGKVDFVELPSKLASEVARITSKAGTPTADVGRVFAPAPTYLRVKQLFPEVGVDKSATEAAAGVLGSIYNHTWRPLQNAWRTTHTLLSGVPGASQYFMTNYQGAVGLGFLSQGLKFADPKLQKEAGHMALLAAGFGDPKAAKAVVEGTDTTLGEIVKMAAEDGAIDQAWVKFARDLSSKDALNRGLQKIADKIGATKAAELTDNYQHAIHYIQGIKKFGTDPLGRAKALDYVHKHSGIYRRMTPLEKKFMREIMPFWAWKRTIYPIVSRAVMENPQRLMAFERMNQHAERVWGSQAPFEGGAVSDWMEIPGGFTSPEGLQPQNLPEDVKRRTKGITDTKFTMSRFERPLSMLSDLTPESLMQQMGPAVYSLASVALGVDISTGEKLPEAMQWFPDLEGVGTQEGVWAKVKAGRDALKKSHLGRGAYSLIQGPSDTIIDTIRLYWDSGQRGEAVELGLRYGLARKLGFVDLLAAEAGQAMGFDIERETAGIPGLSTYPQDAEFNRLQEQERIMERARFFKQ